MGLPGTKVRDARALHAKNVDFVVIKTHLSHGFRWYT